MQVWASKVWGHLPVVPGVNQPCAVTSWRVKIRVVWRAEWTVEVPQPFSTSGDVAVNLIAEVLRRKFYISTKKVWKSWQTKLNVFHKIWKTGIDFYLAVDAAVTTQAVRQAGVDAGVPGQAGELVQITGLEGEGWIHTQLLVWIVATLVHGVTAPPVWDALPIGAVELVHITAGCLRFT